MKLVTFVMSQFMYHDQNSVRSQLARELVSKAKSRECLVRISDGTGGQFRRDIELRGANVSEQVQGMGPDRRRLMRLVYRNMEMRDVALWTEEKPSLIDDLELIIGPIMMDQADLVIPARTEEAWATHPPEQVLIEKFCNRAFKAFTNVEIDCWFGPFAANAKALGHFIAREEDGTDDKWMSIHGPRVDVIAAGLRVKSVPVPKYRYDARQRAEEEGNTALILKRVEQANNLVPALYARAKALGLVA